MSPGVLTSRLDKIEEAVAESEYPRAKEFLESWCDAPGKALSAHISDAELIQTICKRLSDVLLGVARKTVPKKRYRQGRRGSKQSLTRDQIRQGVEFARLSPEELAAENEWLLAGLRKALGELVQDEGLRQNIERKCGELLDAALRRAKPED